MTNFGHVCVIRQGHYPFDPRVRREVTALTERGHEVDVICLRGEGEGLRERSGGVTVYRLPLAFRRRGIARYLAQYLAFLVCAGVIVAALGVRRRYALVQVHSLPDVLVFAALGPKLLGARVVLDLHETMVEFFATKFPRRASPSILRLVAAAEQASIRFADVAITCTEDMREAFVGRGADPASIGVVHNSTEEEIFDIARHPPKRTADGFFTLVCHGSVEERYGIDTAISALHILREEIPHLRLEVYGTGTYLDDVRALAQRLGVTDRVWFSGAWVPLPELVRAIAGADVGVVAMKRDAFRDLTHCNKMYDFITMRIPVLSSRTRSVERYFDDGCFEYFTSDDAADLARAIRAVHDDAEHRERLVGRASKAAEPYRWHHQRKLYLDHVDRALTGNSS